MRLYDRIVKKLLGGLLVLLLFSAANANAKSIPSITTSATNIVAGGPLVATVRNGPGHPKDWVGLYPVGSALNYPLGSEWEYMNGTQTLPASGIQNASLSFIAWATPGRYQFRLYDGSTGILVAETPIITVTATSAKVLFQSGFAPAVALGAPTAGGSAGWQYLTGQENGASYSWPITAWSGSSGIQNYTTAYSNQLQTITDHEGNQTPVLFQSMNNVNDSISQVDLIWLPTNGLTQQTDVYTSEQIYLQPDLSTQLVPGMLNGLWGNWRSLYGWKTGGQGANYGGDFRIEGMIREENNGQLCWAIEWDTNANGPVPLQTFYAPPDNCEVAVPVGQWFQLETFTHRAADNTGEFWAKVNGATVTDHFGPNLGSGVSYCNGPCPINRFFLTLDYTNGHVPAWQYVDDITIMNGVP